MALECTLHKIRLAMIVDLKKTNCVMPHHIIRNSFFFFLRKTKVHRDTKTCFMVFVLHCHTNQKQVIRLFLYSSYKWARLFIWHNSNYLMN